MNLIDVLNWMDTATQDDLKHAQEQLKMKQALNAYSFKPGDKVKFYGRHGLKRGTFIKHATKNVQVLVDGVRWTVSPQLIQDDTAISVVPTTLPKV